MSNTASGRRAAFWEVVISQYRSQEFKKHVIDGVCGPGDRCYGIEVKVILEKYKKWEKKKP
jgi:hypothetical protein